MGVDEGLEVVDEQAAVPMAFAAATANVASRGVFRHASDASVGYTDEDDGFNLAGFCKRIGGGVSSPRAVGDEGGTTVDKVLTIM